MTFPAHLNDVCQLLHAVNAQGQISFPAASFATAALERGCTLAEAQRLLDGTGQSFNLARLPEAPSDDFYALPEFRLYRVGSCPAVHAFNLIQREDIDHENDLAAALHTLNRLYIRGPMIRTCADEEARWGKTFGFATAKNVEAVLALMERTRGTTQSESVLAPVPDEEPFL